MATNKHREIQALLHLLDDPDREVYETVENRLLSYGHSVIPNLEDYWENSLSPYVQDRVEMIIHRIHYQSLRHEFENWKNGEADLLYGAFLVAKYQYPELQSIQAQQELERMRRNIWLELNSYLTPLEQAKIMESILYNFYKMRGHEIAYHQPKDFMIHEAIESKRGNAIILGILYLVLAEQLDMPIRAINIPRQFVLGWFSHQVLYGNNLDTDAPWHHISFYIDPNSGAAFAHKDVELYFKRIGVPVTTSYFKPQTNKQIIQLLLEQFAQCFAQDEKYLYKKEELESLSALIGS
ncbi:MAG TPA: transglutaminase-like domain-containing protein [Phnomibacter sp.]|nr:transglutaminase-like domain-containing protein [Phnomibacter sp.]